MIHEQYKLKNICVYNVPKVQWRSMRQQIWRDLKVQWAPCQNNIYTIKTIEFNENAFKKQTPKFSFDHDLQKNSINIIFLIWYAPPEGRAHTILHRRVFRPSFGTCDYIWGVGGMRR